LPGSRENAAASRSKWIDVPRPDEIIDSGIGIGKKSNGLGPVRRRYSRPDAVFRVSIDADSKRGGS